MGDLPETVDGLPNISGAEAEVERAIAAAAGRPVFLPESRIDFGRIKSAFANALHMHQPLIPAGGRDLRTAEVIGNLQHMFENQGIGDNHNASVFQWCYKRMGEFIPQLVGEGKEPRIMLEYSGTLLHGLRKQGADDVFDSLKRHHLQPRLSPLRRVAGRALGPRRRALDAGAGLPPACEGLAAPFRRHLRPRGACPRARLLALGDGAAQPPGRRLRIRQDAQGLRLPVGVGAGALRRRARGRLEPPPASPAAPARVHATRKARRRASSRSSRRRAPTPNSWRRCSPPTRRGASAGSSSPAGRCRRW